MSIDQFWPWLKENRPYILWKLVLACLFVIPLSQFLSTRFIFLLFLVSLIFYRPKATEIIKDAWHIWFYFSILIGGLFYSQDFSFGLSFLETSFTLFAFPFILGNLQPLDSNKFRALVLSFISGLLLASVVCVINAAISFYATGSPSVFFFYHFTDVLDFQPTYFAYFLSFAISALLYFIHYRIGNQITIYWLLILFFFTILMLTAGRTAYISMLFVFAFFILKFLFEERKSPWTKLTFTTSVLLLGCMLSINYFDVNASFNITENNTDYWERLTLWKSGLSANTNLFFGVGTGDYKNVLNSYLVDHGLIRFAKENFNTHNQFIQLFLSNGLLGLISLLFLLGRPLYLSIKFQNVLGIMTFFSFSIYGITEVFLGRYQGVVFFSFLNQVFVTHFLSQKPTNGS